MEAAKIEWSRIESVFVIDEVYEDINAPQWVDFLISSQSHHHHHHGTVDDDAWFCRPECNHPKRAEDFLKSSRPLQMLRSVTVNREPNLKYIEEEDSENQDPNCSAPGPAPGPLLHRKIKSTKAAFKQQLEGDEENDVDMVRRNGGLKDTHSLSAKDLFGGGEILAKITGLCTELKKMASLTRPKDTTDQDRKQPNPPPSASRSKERPVLGERPHLLKANPKEKRSPLPLKASPYRNQIKSAQSSDDTENVPISLHLRNNKLNHQETLLPIRTNPPTPQGFSATHAPTSSTPSKGPKSRLMKTEILEEAARDGTLRAELGEKCSTLNDSVIAGKQGRALDVLWFLKPCTL